MNTHLVVITLGVLGTLVLYFFVGFILAIYVFALDLKLRRRELPAEQRCQFTFWDHILEGDPRSRLYSVLFFLALFSLACTTWVHPGYWHVVGDMRNDLKNNCP